MAYTDEDLLKITEAVRSSLVNSGTNTATVTEATNIGDVADIVTHNAQGKLTRISPNNFNKENISRLQGTSENSNAMKDPFKFVGSFNTSTIGDLRTWLDNLHGTSSGLDNRGFYRAILNDSVIEITSSPINYATEEYIQVVRGRVSVASTTGLLTFSYEYNILDRKYSATDGWSSWRVVASADTLELLNNAITAAETNAIEQGRRAALIDLYRLIGAYYNKSTDTFTFNTVAGLSWTDMGTTFAYRDLIYRLNIPRVGQQISNLRVLAPLASILTSRSINIQGLNTFYGTSIELFALAKVSSTTYDTYLNSVRTDTAPVCTYMYDTFRLCSKLKTVFPINLKGCATLKKESFAGCVALEELRLLNLPLSLNLADSPLISKTSILYIVTNAAPASAITITLHADAYARLASDADIVAALEGQPLITLVSA